MRGYLRGLTAFAICVFAALPVLTVKVTAYSPVPKCTKKGSPHITASGFKITQGHYYRVIALSPDLAKGHKFGDQFRLEVGGKCYFVEFQDKMPNKHRRSI